MVQRTDVIFSILGFSQLVNEELYAVGRWADESQAAQVSHLFSFLVVKTVGQVDIVIE
jgi:hypothetical protein